MKNIHPLIVGCVAGLASCIPAQQSADSTALAGFDRKVKPGAVRWHSSHAAALAAAAKSGKPVLHFQLLGRLDDEFC